MELIKKILKWGYVVFLLIIGIGTIGSGMISTDLESTLIVWVTLLIPVIIYWFVKLVKIRQQEAVEIVSCKSCGQDINRFATICPNCGMKRSQPLLGALIMVIGIMITVFAVIKLVM